MNNLTALLSRLGELERKATPRPWGSVDYRVKSDEMMSNVASTCVAGNGRAFRDAELIAAARNALPVLLEILKVQGEALEFYATQWRSDVYVGPTDALLRDEGSSAKGALTTAEKLAQGLESGK